MPLIRLLAVCGLAEGLRARDRREEAGGSSAEDGEVAGGGH